MSADKITEKALREAASHPATALAGDFRLPEQLTRDFVFRINGRKLPARGIRFHDISFQARTISGPVERPAHATGDGVRSSLWIRDLYCIKWSHEADPAVFGQNADATLSYTMWVLAPPVLLVRNGHIVPPANDGVEKALDVELLNGSNPRRPTPRWRNNAVAIIFRTGGPLKHYAKATEPLPTDIAELIGDFVVADAPLPEFSLYSHSLSIDHQSGYDEGPLFERTESHLRPTFYPPLDVKFGPVVGSDGMLYPPPRHSRVFRNVFRVSFLRALNCIIDDAAGGSAIELGSPLQDGFPSVWEDDETQGYGLLFKDLENREEVQFAWHSHVHFLDDMDPQIYDESDWCLTAWNDTAAGFGSTLRVFERDEAPFEVLFPEESSSD